MSAPTLTHPPAAVAVPPPGRLPAGTGPVAAMLVAAALWVASLPHVDLAGLSDIGLITALPPGFFASVAVLTAGFFAEVGRDRPRPAVLWAGLVMAVVFLQGVVAVVEGAPRFPTSWIHAGFTNQIADHHATLPMLDARFSWPGFFAVAALVQSVAGLDTALWFVRWSPVAFGLATLLPAAAILRAADVSDRARWTALWLFCVANWVGQDYFAPQALGFLLYLVVLAVLLTYFRPAEPQPVPLFPGVPSAETPVATTNPRLRVGLVLAIAASFAAVTVSHQLTPFALVAATAALVVGRRTTLRLLPALFGVGAMAWLSFAAEPYWVGHLADVTGGLGKLGGSLQSGLNQRLGGSAGHLFVVRLRLVATVLLLVLAVAGVARSFRRRGAVPWPHVLLLAAPFSLVAMQSYGGEILLRVYLFALPFTTLLAALAFFPGRDASRRALVAAGATSLAVIAAFLTIRYGNERFESFTEAEVEAVEWVYEHAPAGSRLVALNSSLPWRHRDLERFSSIGRVEVPHLDETSELVDYLTARPRADGYLIVTRSQEAHGELVDGLAPGWTAEVIRLARASGRVEVVFRNQDAVILRHPGSAA